MLHRSALFVPGDHERGVAKAPSLNADIIIFDLEDGVAPEHKTSARHAIVQSLNANNFSALTLVRVNHHATHYFCDDIEMAATSNVDGLVLSKVDHLRDVEHAVKVLATHDRADLPIWANIETPQGVMHAHEIAANAHINGLIAGTNDLRNDLHMPYHPERLGLMHSLQTIQLAARAHGKKVLDGTFIDLENKDGLRLEAEQGRLLGFDGKTLIHPKQIDAANRAFSPTEKEINHARAIKQTYEAAMKDHKAVVLLDGKMIERLHYNDALKMLEISQDI